MIQLVTGAGQFIPVEVRPETACVLGNECVADSKVQRGGSGVMGVLKGNTAPGGGIGHRRGGTDPEWVPVVVTIRGVEAYSHAKCRDNHWQFMS